MAQGFMYSHARTHIRFEPVCVRSMSVADTFGLGCKRTMRGASRIHRELIAVQQKTNVRVAMMMMMTVKDDYDV